MSESGRRDPTDQSNLTDPTDLKKKATREPALLEKSRPLVTRAQWNHPVPFRTRK